MGVSDPPLTADPKRLPQGHPVSNSIPEGADQECVSTQVSVSSGNTCHACQLEEFFGSPSERQTSYFFGSNFGAIHVVSQTSIRDSLKVLHLKML